MDHRYFNYSTHIAENGWAHRRFLKQWRQIYGSDKRWVPLHYRQLALLRQPHQHEHLARYHLRYLYLEALPRRRQASAMGAALWEEVVAAAIVAVDPKRQHDTGLLMLLHCANDEEVLDRLLGVALEELSHQGCYRLVGPVGPSPHLASGLLENYYHQLPPLHTPYNPPYLPELMNSSLHPWQQLALRHVPLPPTVQGIEEQPEHTASGKVALVPLTAALALSETFLPLWQAAALPQNLFPAPDRAEVAFIWTWLTVWPWAGWVAIAHERPIGFLLLQPDLAAQSRRAGGGRNPLWAWWLQWRSQRPVAQGRLTYGAILPAWQGRGIEELFWQKTWHYSQQQVWQALTVGPHILKKDGQAIHNAILPAALLSQERTVLHQRYTIYASER